MAMNIVSRIVTTPIRWLKKKKNLKIKFKIKLKFLK